jgi:alpha-D-xyloside xylohydrolase
VLWSLDYPNDVKTFNLTDQYQFGLALIVCSVITPMYYERNSQPIPDAPKTRTVYLPANNQWYDFWTETIYDPDQFEKLRTEPIPPLVPSAPYETRIYRGPDTTFMIYEDAGDTYDYEKGAFALISLSWFEDVGQLTIHHRQSTFPELVNERQYNIIFISKQGRQMKSVLYTGKDIQITASNI